jgi:hypothetical protein
MDSPTLERQKAEHHTRKRNVIFAALAFVVLIPAPLALAGQIQAAGILCILAAIFAAVQPEFGAEPTVAVHDALTAAGKAPLPQSRAAAEEESSDPVVLAKAQLKSGR